MVCTKNLLSKKCFWFESTMVSDVKDDDCVMHISGDPDDSFPLVLHWRIFKCPTLKYFLNEFSDKKMFFLPYFHFPFFIFTINKQLFSIVFVQKIKRMYMLLNTFLTMTKCSNLHNFFHKIPFKTSLSSYETKILKLRMIGI